MTVLYSARTTPLAKNSSNALATGINLAWDFTGVDAAHMNGVPWVFGGATSPSLPITGTQTLATVNGEPGRVAGTSSLYNYTNATDFGLQTGTGDFCIGIRVSTPSALPSTGNTLELLHVKGSAGDAFIIYMVESAGAGWYFSALAGACPLGGSVNGTMHPVNTTLMLWIQKVSGVVTVYQQNVTTGGTVVERYSASTTTATALDSTNSAQVIANYTFTGPSLGIALHAITHWPNSMTTANLTAIGNDFWNLEANTAAVDTTAPTVVAAAVANATPTVVSLSMSEALDTGSVPAASAFTVSGHTVSSVAISGSTINLTVSSAFVNGEAARTVAYTQPGTNNARDLATTPNLLANFSALAITNNVAGADVTKPILVSAVVANSAPANIVLTMSETLAAFTPAASAFAVSGGKTVTSVARSGAVVTLTCSAAYAYGDAITVTYTKPGAGMLQDAAGNQTDTFGPSAVTNNVAAPPSLAGVFASDAWISSGTIRSSQSFTATWYSGGVIGTVAGSPTFASGTLSAGGVATLTGLPAGAGFLLGKTTDGGRYYQEGTVT